MAMLNNQRVAKRNLEKKKVHGQKPTAAQNGPHMRSDC
jgi:hypothetical protein